MFPLPVRILLFVTAVLGSVLFTIGIFAPGWEITHHGLSLKGVWFFITCYTKCDYHTYLEKYNAEKNSGHFMWINEYEYSTVIGNQIIALFSLLLCYLGTLLSLATVWIQKLSNVATFLATPCFLVSGVLIWTHIGQEAATISAKNSVFSPTNANWQSAPYALVITSLGSFFTICVAVTYFVSSLKYVSRLPVEKYENF